MQHDGQTCSWTALCVPKRGNVSDEIEDAFAANLRRRRFAVADGASESSSAGLWAQLLVQRFVQTPGPWSRWLPAVRDTWRTATAGENLPWYAETKREEGAYATLLGLTLSADGTWEALAVGDSCLFQVRGDRLLRAFPVTRSTEFGSRPELLRSRIPEGRVSRVARRRAHGRWLPGDRLLLMTDALAGWFLRQTEAGRRPWQELAECTEEAFGPWIERRRDKRELLNDDVTLLQISGAERRAEPSRREPS